MSMTNNRRKGMFKKGHGFSRYNEQGLVIYSESIGSTGNTITHHYEYDELGRRIHYYQKTWDYDPAEGDEFEYIIFEEFTVYYDNGSSWVRAIDYNAKNIYGLMTGAITERTIDSNGRNQQIKSYDMVTGFGTLTVYDAYKNAYFTTDIREVFIPHGIPVYQLGKPARDCM